MTKSPIEGAFQRYLQEIKKSVSKGDYTEMTLRTPLENFIKALNSDYDVTHEAKRIKALGAPDFTAYRSGVNVGYIEAKDLGKNLDEELVGSQLKKYRESIDNIVLTDYRRFILIRGNQTIFDQSLFSLADLSKPKSHISERKIEEFLQLTDTFFGYNQPTIRSAKILAEELAKKTKLLKDLASEQLEEDLKKVEQGDSPSPLYDFFEALAELIKDISVEACADAYAQTIAYGLFLAKINYKKTLDRDTAASHIPRSIKIIRKIFASIADEPFPPNVSWIVDVLIDILNAAEIDAILTDIDFRGKTDRDPYTYFYEDFLAFYEPDKKRELGVYYTPRPVVSFIANSINLILKNEFGKPMGFAEDDVNVLDPGVGTGTFLWLVYLLAILELKKRGLGGIRRKKIRDHVLKDFYGFEILITSYIIAHLKLTAVLKKWSYELDSDDRIQVYLTNTLDPFETHGHIPFFRELSEESTVADEIKLKRPILVVLGNPPYRGMSINKGPWIENLLKVGYTRADGTTDSGYYRVDGKPLGEKNPKWLLDDYVKFIRFAQWKIDSIGDGIVGLITNHAFIDNPTFKGMRQSLMHTFDQIYILNLHGNAKKKEKAPDGSKDENVFDIQQGVAISFFLKNSKIQDKGVYYADVYGDRTTKYEWLDRNSIRTTQWTKLTPTTPHYLFAPFDCEQKELYNTFWQVTDIFPINSVGIVTGRDKLTIKWTPEEVWETVNDFVKSDPEYAREKYYLGKDVQDWKVDHAQKDLKESGLNRELIKPILYRPFDIRYTYYTGESGGFHCRPRPEVMRQMLKGNIALITSRLTKGESYRHTFVSKTLSEVILLSSKTSNNAFVFPLYLHKGQDKVPNLSNQLIDKLTADYGQKPTPEQVFYYVYATLHSPAYRDKYEGCLRIDFPRVPFVEEYTLFEDLAQLGQELVALHLLTIRLPTTTKFDIEGSNVVQSVKYSGGRVYINKAQYFFEVPKEVWEFHIGGYQVLDKWLKNRKNRELQSNEIELFLQIVEVIKKTIKLVKEIDGVLLPHFTFLV